MRKGMTKGMTKIIASVLIIGIISSDFSGITIAKAEAGQVNIEETNTQIANEQAESQFIGVIDSPDASAVKITTAEELFKIREDLYGSYVLQNDIDLSEYESWIPIGMSLEKAFHGKLDGQGHSIKGLKISENINSGSLTGVYYGAGLFGVCKGAEIKNIKIDGANISIISNSGYKYNNATITPDFSFYAGTVAGYIDENTVVYNCITSGNVLSKAEGEAMSDTIAGGLVGAANSGIISYSHSDCVVEAYNGNALQKQNACVGGLIGKVGSEVIIERSYNRGKVTARTLDFGEAYAGGIVGFSENANCKISDCYNAGECNSRSGNLLDCDDAYAGGIAGIFSGEIKSVYNSGRVLAQLVDPYGICGGIAYAGGICGKSTETSSISNSAIVQPIVSAINDGDKYQYRISYQGVKNKNITIDSVPAGSTNDADYIQTVDVMKTDDPYINKLGWNFSVVWEMRTGDDFPQLKIVDRENDEYKEEYIKQHMEYIHGNEYKNILINERWAQTYWSDENTLASNAGEKLYKFTDALVDLSQFKFDFFFEDGPYKVLLADYVSNQTVQQEVVQLQKVEFSKALTTTYKKSSEFIKANWKDEWGELSDEDLFWLYHYKDASGEQWINQDFEKHLYEIVYGERTGGKKFEEVLGITSETLDTVLKEKENLDSTIEAINEMLESSANLYAYLEADKKFKIILEKMCDNLPDSTNEERKYKQELKKEIERYIQCNADQNVVETIFFDYSMGVGEKVIENQILRVAQEQVKKYIGETFSKAALFEIEIIGKVANATWAISEYVTKNGEIQECREMLRANAYFESAMYNTLQAIQTDFLSDTNIENAELFDAAFKFFKETELYSMDVCIKYCETCQASWLQTVKHASNTFLNSFIEEVHIHKLFLYRSYCHGTKYQLGGKIITVACPTDVAIFDEKNNLVASIKGNEIVQCSMDILAYTADAVKIFVVPLDQQYTVKVMATDNGIMNYSISEFDETMKKEQIVIYSDIPIRAGQSFIGIASNVLNETPANYNLTDGNGDVIDSFQQVDEENVVAVKALNIIADSDTMQIGQEMNLSYSIAPENASLKNVVWSSSDPNVAQISEKGRVTAISEGSAVIAVQTLFGGKKSVITINVIDETEHKIDGGYKYDKTMHWHECSECKKRIDENKHSFGAWIEEKAATGLKYRVCDVCGYRDEEVFSSFEHIHTYGSDWEKNETSHWHECASDGAKSGEAAHTFVWKVDKAATKTEIGLKHEECAVCGFKKSEGTVIEKLPDDTPEPAPAETVTVSQVIKDTKVGAEFKVTDVNTKTVVYIKSTKKDAKTVTIPATVTIDGVKYKVVEIAKNAFKNNKKLTTVKGGANVEVIGANAFSGCSKLKSMAMGKNITTISDKAFYKCTSLTKITIPSKVGKIGKAAFYGAKKLKTITIKTSKLTSENVGRKAFKGTAKTATVKVPEEKFESYKKWLTKKGISKNAKIKK